MSLIYLKASINISILICFNNNDYIYLLHNFEHYELSGKFNQ